MSGNVPPLLLRMAVIIPPFHPLELPLAELAANWEIVNIPNAALGLVMLHAPLRP